MRGKIGVLALVCVAVSATTTMAQVINGEGTYEGSSLHQPPEPEPEPPRAKGSGKAHDDTIAPRAAVPKRSD